MNNELFIQYYMENRNLEKRLNTLPNKFRRRTYINSCCKNIKDHDVLTPLFTFEMTMCPRKKYIRILLQTRFKYERNKWKEEHANYFNLKDIL